MQNQCINYVSSFLFDFNTILRLSVGVPGRKQVFTTGHGITVNDFMRTSLDIQRYP